MLNIHTLTLGAYGTNCYIVHDSASETCCVIDPGYTPEKVLSEVNALGLTVEAILLTHGHFDHVGGVKEIAAETGCDVYLCADELTMPPQMTAGPLYYTKTYDEGDTLHLAGLTISVIRTPGHTPGSVCLLIDDAMFSGDTLFAGSCGRTDFPAAATRPCGLLCAVWRGFPPTTGSTPATAWIRRWRRKSGITPIYDNRGSYETDTTRS